MLVVMVVIFVFSHRAGDASSEQSNAVGETEQCRGRVGARDPRDRDPARAVRFGRGYLLGIHDPEMRAHFFVSAPRGKRIFVCLTFAVSYGTGVAARCLRGRRGGNILSLCLSG